MAVEVCAVAVAKQTESARAQAEILKQAGSNERTKVRFTGPLLWIVSNKMVALADWGAGSYRKRGDLL